MTDLKRAFTALNAKLLPYDTLFAYAGGNQPLIYSTARLREAFRDLSANFQQNWCALVINATLDRLQLAGWDTKDKAPNVVLDNLWNELRLSTDAYDAHKAALITQEGFIIAWKDGDKLDVYQNDPRSVHVFYDPARPKVKQFAAKWWSDGAHWNMTLYYPDHLEYYVTSGKSRPSSANGFKAAEIPRADNPFGVIPVFHFRGLSGGELENIITLQDAINKLFADLMVTAEFSSFKQRYIITNGDTEAIANSPYDTWILSPGDGEGQGTQVGQFDATPLANHLDAMDRVANSIAVISRTPKHYFMNNAGQLSGEALLAMESPLTKKVKTYQERLGATWQELGAFLLKLTGAGDYSETDIVPVWKPAESIQPYTEAQTRQLAVAAGIPLVTELRREGWGEDEIKNMQKDEDDAKKRNAKLAPLLLDEARNQSNNSNDNLLEKDEGENNVLS